MNMSDPYNSAQICRDNGWEVGDVLEGDEGYGPTRIRLTAIGESDILARALSHKGKPLGHSEAPWTLSCRDWKRVEKAPIRINTMKQAITGMTPGMAAFMTGAPLPDEFDSLEEWRKAMVEQGYAVEEKPDAR